MALIEKKTITKAYDWGIQFLFFVVIYVILLIKIASAPTLIANWFFSTYSIVITTYILSRFVFSYFHKSFPVDDSYEPTVTFVVPAKNEGPNVYETLRRFSDVLYPREKIEVIAIDDGSTDQTLAEMLRAKKDLRDTVNIKIIHWDVNRGKRHGMAEGVRRANHDIVIFIDSDSFVEKNCVRHLVKYFSLPEVGAVSGHTDVYNRDTNLLTRMQAVRYFIAFKVYKAAESVFGNVTCCPGCCSAYRRTYLLEFLDEWLTQKFFGKECTFGDDRSLTNFMIRKYKAVYSPEAKAYTIVPDTFDTYFRQQQRWKKSWVRETLIASTFFWKKNALPALSFYAYVFLSLSSPVVFFRAALWHPILEHALPVHYFIGLLLMLLLHGLYYRKEVGKQPWLLAIMSFWFHTIILIWQLPWAIITIADTRWGTR